MAAKNQVNLTFAGDTDDIEKAFDRVGGAAREMDGDVDQATSSFDNMGGGLDSLDDKAGGMEASFRGSMDVMSGFGSLAEGDVLQGVTDLGGGVSSLAQGLGSVLVPALQKSVSWLAKTKVGILAQAAASKVASAATKIWSGIQAAFNVIMSLNPIGLIIVAIVALVAAIVLAWKNSETFRDVVMAVWEGVKAAVEAVVNWFTDTAWPAIQAVWDGIVAGAELVWKGIKKYFSLWKTIFDTVIGWVTGLWDTARENFDKLVGFVAGLPGRITSAASGMFNGIRDAFKGALNWIIDRWNGLSFTLPSAEFLGQTIGGQTLSTPNIPRFHTGGTGSGAFGKEFLAVLKAGERVTPTGPRQDRGGRMTVEAGDGGGSVEQALASLLLHMVRIGALRLVVRNGQVAVA